VGLSRHRRQVKGVNVDILRTVVAGLGVKHINFVVGDFGSLIPGLISKRFDVVDSGVVITSARCKLVDFGNPEVSSLDAMLVAKGNPKNIHSFSDVVKKPNVTIGGSRGGQQTKDASLAGVPDAKLQQFQNTESTVSALVAGRVDGIVFTSATARVLLQQPVLKDKMELAKPFTGLIDPHTHKDTLSYIGPVFNKDALQLSAAYNQNLAALVANGTVAKIVAKYGFSNEEQVPAGLTSATICAQ
jgi:polar amino acid transport system substrate-binding protein